MEREKGPDLVHCDHCGRDFPAEFPACMHCGRPPLHQQEPGHAAHRLLTLFAVLVVVSSALILLLR